MGHRFIMRIISCPIPGYDDVEDGKPQYYVGLPDTWLGKHAVVRDAAIETAKGQGIDNDSLATFAVSLALADDFRLPGLDGKPDNWDFGELSLELISWVNFAVYASFNRDFTVKKSYLLASLNGHLAKEMTDLLGISAPTG